MSMVEEIKKWINKEN